MDHREGNRPVGEAAFSRGAIHGEVGSYVNDIPASSSVSTSTLGEARNVNESNPDGDDDSIESLVEYLRHCVSIEQSLNRLRHFRSGKEVDSKHCAGPWPSTADLAEDLEADEAETDCLLQNLTSDEILRGIRIPFTTSVSPPPFDADDIEFPEDLLNPLSRYAHHPHYHRLAIYREQPWPDLRNIRIVVNPVRPPSSATFRLASESRPRLWPSVDATEPTISHSRDSEGTPILHAGPARTVLMTSRPDHSVGRMPATKYSTEKPLPPLPSDRSRRVSSHSMQTSGRNRTRSEVESMTRAGSHRRNATVANVAVESEAPRLCLRPISPFRLESWTLRSSGEQDN